MQTVKLEEIKNIADYEVEREAWRPQVMALKDRRRVRVGGHLTFLFENRDTVRYQIQEMMRIERIVKAEDIAREVETYNELIPGPGQLSASLLSEYDTPEERDVHLRELLGIENTFGWWWVILRRHSRCSTRGRSPPTASARCSTSSSNSRPGKLRASNRAPRSEWTIRTTPLNAR